MASPSTIPSVSAAASLRTTNQEAAQKAADDSTEPDSAQSTITSDFETFLTMLTAQLENQDPLNPVESSDYATQLATFSSVEQQVLTNDLLKQLVGGSELSGLGNLAGWVGMEARVGGDFTYSDGPVTLHFDMPADRTDALLVIYDENGAAVRELPLRHEQSAPISWSGLNDAGIPVAAGRYSAQVVRGEGENRVSIGSVETFGRITEVREGSAGAEVVLQDGTVLPSSSVTALRKD